MIVHEAATTAGHDRHSQFEGLVVTDLDGTLLRSDGTIHTDDIRTLEELGENGYLRVIATGRSVFSFNRGINIPVPVDYIVFSTGAAVMKYPENRIIRSVNLERREVEYIQKVLMNHGLDFMVHRAVPDNHMFAYHWTGRENPDFIRRLALYEGFCRPLNPENDAFDRAAQLIAVVPGGMGQTVYDTLRSQLQDKFNVIRTTSPLDGVSTWVEVFPGDVSKSLTTAWLATRLGIRARHVMAVGNDYNDLDLLQWSGAGFVVDNAPRDLKYRFASVASNDDAGVTDAVHAWLGEKSRR